MQYLLICFENENYWLEINEQLIAVRQVIIDKDLKIHISCREDCLAEGIIEIGALDGMYKEVSKKDFENIWKLAIKTHYEDWVKLKLKYPIGQKVKGVCKYFYPQGAIIKGKDYIAVYNGTKEVLINEYLTAQIKEYDENNLWLVLE